MAAGTASRLLIIVGTFLLTIFTLYTVVTGLQTYLSNPIDPTSVIPLLGLIGLLLVVIGATVQRIRR